MGQEIIYPADVGVSIVRNCGTRMEYAAMISILGKFPFVIFGYSHEHTGKFRKLNPNRNFFSIIPNVAVNTRFDLFHTFRRVLAFPDFSRRFKSDLFIH